VTAVRCFIALTEHRQTSHSTAAYRKAPFWTHLLHRLHRRRCCSCHGTPSHFYADDMQMHISCHPHDIDDLLANLSSCVADVEQWCAAVFSCASRRLQMDSDKTEIVSFASLAHSAKYPKSSLFSGLFLLLGTASNICH
jgi:hypothetical protein